MSNFHEFEKKTIDGVKRKDGNNRTDRAIVLPQTEKTEPSDAYFSSSGREEFIAKEKHSHEDGASEGDGNGAESGVIVAKEPLSGYTDSGRMRRSFGSRTFWAWAGGIAAILFLAAIVSTVFARLTIVIKPRVENVEIRGVSAVFDVSAPKIVKSQGLIPAELLEFEKTVQKEFDATGEEYVNEKSKGKAIIYNAYSSSPQTLIATTRFLTKSGALFRLPKTMVIPGAKVEDGTIVPQSAEVELVADAYGEGSNLGGPIALFIQGFQGSAKYEKFYAEAPLGFQGGFQGRARVISKADRTKAEELQSKQALDELRLEIARKIPPHFTFIDGLAKMDVLRIDIPEEKTRAEHFQARVTAAARILVFREEDVQEFLTGIVLNEKEGKIVDGSFSVRPDIQQFDSIQGKARAIFTGSVKTKTVVSLSELAALLHGKKESSIIEILKARKELTDFNVAFFPPWIFFAPDNEKKIKFIVE